jgi:hypothetical protein
VRVQGPSKRFTRGSDTRYIELNHGKWRVVVGQREGGRIVKLQRSLGTASLREAQRLRWPVVAELKALIAGKTRGQSTESAEAWRAALAAGDSGPDDPAPYLRHDHLDAVRGDPIATEPGEEGPVYIYDPEWERRATEFADRAYGRATPLDTYLDPFLASRGKLREDTERRHRWAPATPDGGGRANGCEVGRHHSDGDQGRHYRPASPEKGEWTEYHSPPYAPAGQLAGRPYVAMARQQPGKPSLHHLPQGRAWSR